MFQIRVMIIAAVTQTAPTLSSISGINIIYVPTMGSLSLSARLTTHSPFMFTTLAKDYGSSIQYINYNSGHQTIVLYF